MPGALLTAGGAVALGAVDGAANAGEEAVLGGALTAAGVRAALSDSTGVDWPVLAANTRRSPITTSNASAKPTTAPTTKSAVRRRWRFTRGAESLELVGAATIPCMSGAAVEVDGGAENWCGVAMGGGGGAGGAGDSASRLFVKSGGIRTVPCLVTPEAFPVIEAVGSVSHEAVGSSFAVVRSGGGSWGGAPNVTAG